MSLSDKQIEHLLELLHKNREALHILLQRRIASGIQTPLSIIMDIQARQTEIATLKATLRSVGVDVDDLPTDEDYSNVSDIPEKQPTQNLVKSELSVKAEQDTYVEDEQSTQRRPKTIKDTFLALITSLFSFLSALKNDITVLTIALICGFVLYIAIFNKSIPNTTVPPPTSTITLKCHVIPPGTTSGVFDVIDELRRSFTTRDCTPIPSATSTPMNDSK